jgi:thiol-disulfide isomerase/thioredoxin
MKITFTILLSALFLQMSPSARGRNIRNDTNKEETIVKVKMANASGCTMLFYNNFTNYGNRVDSIYKEENGYKVYTLKHKYSHVEFFIIKYPPSKADYKGTPQLLILLKKGAVITIEGDANRPIMSKVTSKDQDVIDYEVFRVREAAIEDESWQASKKKLDGQVQNDSIGHVLLSITILKTKRAAWEKEFVKMYPHSYAGLEIFYRYYKNIDKELAASVFSGFPEVYKNEGVGAEIAVFFEKLRITKSGNKILAFREKGIDGKMINTDSLKGKVLIVDFWGSWCGPCRKSHPHLKALYDKYHDKGLEIIGVADEGGGDSERLQNNWRKAVQEDGLPWLQILNDTKGTDLVNKYAVTSFPTKFVIDRNGMIVLKVNNSVPEELDRTLEELFK